MAKTRETQARHRKLFVSAKEQALRVNTIKYSMYKTSDTLLCRLCDGKTTYNTH